MTRKLEELFNLPPSDTEDDTVDAPTEITKASLAELDDTIDKIDQALPTVRGLDASDSEMDELAKRATETFDDLMDLGMNVDSRFSSEIFAVASTMLGHAITAKTAKLNKKLKMVDLQLKKLKMDQDSLKNQDNALPTAEGKVMTRNDLLEMLKNNRDQKDVQA